MMELYYRPLIGPLLNSGSFDDLDCPSESFIAANSYSCTCRTHIAQAEVNDHKYSRVNNLCVLDELGGVGNVYGIIVMVTSQPADNCH